MSDEHHQSEFAHLGCPDKECRGRSMNIPLLRWQEQTPRGLASPAEDRTGQCGPGPGVPRACSHHFSHLEAQFLMRCCQHGQGPSSRVLQLVVILATEQHHQLQPVVAIGQEPLLYLWEAGTRLREKSPARGGEDASGAVFSDSGLLRALL